MRLTELDPHWIGLCPGHAWGLSFVCPCCARNGKEDRIAVFFDEAIGLQLLERVIGRAVINHEAMELLSKHKWHREGETFDTLTLTPSVDASEHGHWHGFITNGAIV